MRRRTVATFLTCAALAVGAALMQAQSPRSFFIQLADPQFGAFTQDKDFVQETANYEFAVANINRLRPAFVVICGDLINKGGDAAQLAEYKRITAKIDPSIPAYAVAGNHDVENQPTPESIAAYRRNIGPDYYSFQRSGIYGIVLDSSLLGSPAKAQALADEQEAWLQQELTRARAAGARHVVFFQHHSFFLEKADEPPQYFNIPLEPRRRYLDLLKAAGVRYVFAGHYHRNAFGRDGQLEMITNGPVGRPLGADPSGLRIVTIGDDALQHTYYGLGNIPSVFPIVAPAARRP